MKNIKVRRALSIATCAAMMSSIVILVSTPRVSAQGFWTETTYDDFIDSEELTLVGVRGTDVDAYVELNKREDFVWENLRPFTAPPSREYFAMAYDEYNQVAVMFGGYRHDSNPPPLGTDIYFDDTWEYDYITNTWTNVTKPGSKPIPLFGHKMAYDSCNQVIVLFGGNDQAWNPRDETWEYDVTTKEWSKVSPSPKPTARSDHAMCYDGTNKKVILFGGMGSGFPPSPLDDTWAYDANSNSWAQMPASGPGGRLLHDMAYDITNKVVVLYAGMGMKGMEPVNYDDTWEYSYPSTWTEITSKTSPGYRTRHAMAFHKSSDWTVLFGGLDDTDDLNDTWIYDPRVGGTKWFKQYPSAPPSKRFGHGMVYDSANDVIILFGGSGDSGVLNDTWILTIPYVYMSGGYMISSPCDSKKTEPGKPDWQYIYFEPETPLAGTFLRIQLANSTDNVSWGEFVGPDGSTGTYYTNGAGEPIWEGHDGHRYLKYQAIFSTMDFSVSPRLDEITFTWDAPITKPRNLMVEKSPPNNITLRWDPVPGASEYHIYESEDRFTSFPTGWTLAMVYAPNTTYTHENALIDGKTHFYIARAYEGTTESGNSTMGVKAHLEFEPSITRWHFDIHWLSLPYNSMYSDASDIVIDIEGGLGKPSKIRFVAKWNRDEQRTEFFYYSRGKWWGEPFDIYPGDGVAIGGIQQNFAWSVCGTDMDYELSFKEGHTDWISIPYTSPYTKASDIVIDIEGGLVPPTKINEVGKWNASGQRWDIYRWDGMVWTGDFTINVGEGIYLHTISDFNWTPELLTPFVT